MTNHGSLPNREPPVTASLLEPFAAAVVLLLRNPGTYVKATVAASNLCQVFVRFVENSVKNFVENFVNKLYVASSESRRHSRQGLFI